MTIQTRMIARIDETDQFNGRTTTIVTTPAPDSFSHPSRFKVYSDQPIGAIGQELMLTVSLRGMVKIKRYTDKNTNQPKVYNEDNTYLDLIKAEPVPAKQPTKAA